MVNVVIKHLDISICEECVPTFGVELIVMRGAWVLLLLLDFIPVLHLPDFFHAEGGLVEVEDCAGLARVLFLTGVLDLQGTECLNIP